MKKNLLSVGTEFLIHCFKKLIAAIKTKLRLRKIANAL